MLRTVYTVVLSGSGIAEFQRVTTLQASGHNFCNGLTRLGTWQVRASRGRPCAALCLSWAVVVVGEARASLTRASLFVTSTMGKNSGRANNGRTITFDDAKRKDYLTGFRKRKKARREYAMKKNVEEAKKQQKDDRLEGRRFKRAQRIGVGVEDLDAIDARMAKEEEEEEEAVAPNAEVTTYEDDEEVTTAVITPLLDEDAGGERPPRIVMPLVGKAAAAAMAAARAGAAAGSGAASAAAKRPAKKPLPYPLPQPGGVQKKKKKKAGSSKPSRFSSKKAKAKMKAPSGPKSRIISRSAPKKGGG